MSIIKISDDIEININFKAVYTPQELGELITQLQAINKVFGRDVLQLIPKAMKEQDNTTKSKGVGRGNYDRTSIKRIIKTPEQHKYWHKVVNDRNEFINILKIYYSNREDKNEVLFNLTGLNFKQISSRMDYLKKKFKVNPQEIGMEIFSFKAIPITE